MARIPYPVPEGTKILQVHARNFVRAFDGNHQVICDIYQGDENPFIEHDGSIEWYCRYADHLECFDTQLKGVALFKLGDDGLVVDSHLHALGMKAKTGYPMPQGATHVHVQQDCISAFDENAKAICTIYNIAHNPFVMEPMTAPQHRAGIRWVNQYENKLECFDKDLNQVTEIRLDKNGQPSVEDIKKAELRLK